ncbi:hypothetical protein ACFLYN_00590 [Chloroflexota bacterium]
MIEKHLIRSLLLEILPREHLTQVGHVIPIIEKTIKERGLFPSQEDCESIGTDYRYYSDMQLNPKDKLTISEVIWDLIQERVLTPGISADNSYPHFRLTEFGKEVISHSAPHYYDPDGYMESLKSIVPNLDSIIEQYILESINCYRRQLFFASAVMIGAAAEKSILLMLEAISGYISDEKMKSKVSLLLERPNLPEIFEAINECINPMIKTKTIPYSVHKGCEEHLLSLFEMIRVQRNDAIHPITGEVSREKVFLSLQTAPVALESVNNFINWFTDNSG